MKLFWMKNWVLIAALLAVLVLGVFFWGGLRLFEGNEMQDVMVRTSFAEAEATAAPTEETGTIGLTGETETPAPTAISPELISADILGLEWKYRSVIPRISNTVPYEAKSWKEGDKVADSLAVEAITRAGELYETLLHRTLDLSAVSVTRYVDEKGYRPNILRLTDEKNDFVCVLRESDLSLLVADNGQIAASEWMDAKKDAATVAEFLGTEAKANDMDRGGSSRNGEWIERSLAYELGDGRWITLAYNRNTLNGIQVHEDKASMEEQVCFVADIYIEDITSLRSAWSKDTLQDSANAPGDVLDLMAREDALLMINGDYVSKWNFGCVVKNGQVARQVDNPRYDACVLLRDGTLLTLDGNKTSSEQILAMDPWQAWCFGPALLDEAGHAKETFNSSLTGPNPRTVLGYYAPGHYCFVVVEGRRDKYSKGMNLQQLSRFMESLGCKAAYNMDGGDSSVLAFDGQRVSKPRSKRSIPDVIYICEPRKEN